MKVEDIDLIKIGSCLYDLHYVKKLKGDSNERLHGLIDCGDLWIKINNKYNVQKQLQTIIHESVHGIVEEIQLQTDEVHVERLSNAIYAFVIDNPILIQKILDYDKEKRK